MFLPAVAVRLPFCVFCLTSGKALVRSVSKDAGREAELPIHPLAKRMWRTGWGCGGAAGQRGRPREWVTPGAPQRGSAPPPGCAPALCAPARHVQSSSVLRSRPAGLLRLLVSESPLWSRPPFLLSLLFLSSTVPTGIGFAEGVGGIGSPQFHAQLAPASWRSSSAVASFRSLTAKLIFARQTTRDPILWGLPVALARPIDLLDRKLPKERLPCRRRRARGAERRVPVSALLPWILLLYYFVHVIWTLWVASLEPGTGPQAPRGWSRGTS